MEIKSIGRTALLERLYFAFEGNDAVTRNDDAAAITNGNEFTLSSSVIMSEGVHFNLEYTPLKHLGYKCVVAAISKICAMNGKASYLSISLGVPARFSVENLEEFYEGVKVACKDSDVVFTGGDMSATVNGLTISSSAIGYTNKDKIVYRSGAKVNDIICITGDIGSAYAGLKLLERERRVLKDNEVAQPMFGGYEYLLERQLKPFSRQNIINLLDESSLVPTSMIGLNDSLASNLKELCHSSKVGARIYLDRLPISQEVFAYCEEINFDPVIAALNGGDDFELLFTVPVDKYDELIDLQGIEVIGYIVSEQEGVALTTPDGGEVTISAPGWGQDNE